MTVSTVLSIILAALRAIPALERLWDQLVAAYVAARISAMQAENRAIIIGAIAKLDQRAIEEALGSSRAGQASGIPGTEIRDTLPGVPK